MPTPEHNLLGMPRAALEAFFADIGERPFRARQLMQWLYKRGVNDFAGMTDLSLPLRKRLQLLTGLRVPEIISRQQAADGTVKWLLRAGNTQAIEMVYIPEKERGTLCISSQVGCALDCSFCATARQGFNRNLTRAEIIGQVWLANRELGGAHGTDRVITNVVLMGMGEPLANYREVLPVLEVLVDDYGYALSRRKVTLSTAGLVPQIERLGSDCNVALAVSLHAANNALRDQLVPINRRHPIESLLDACWRYTARRSNRHVTFEYVMLDGVNDSPTDARQLTRLLRSRPAKVNLIPFNPFADSGYRRSPTPVIEQFREYLNQHDVLATIRRPRGDDIDAACGQLAGRVRDRIRVPLGTKLMRPASAGGRAGDNETQVAGRG